MYVFVVVRPLQDLLTLYIEDDALSELLIVVGGDAGELLLVSFSAG